MANIPSVKPVEPEEEIVLTTHGSEIYVVAGQTRTLSAVLLHGKQASSLIETRVQYVTPSGDILHGATYQGYGRKGETQDRVLLDLENNAAALIDGYGKTLGEYAAAIMQRALRASDVRAGVTAAQTAMTEEKLAGKAGACFMRAAIIVTPGGKELDPAGAGDVHLLVLDDKDDIVYESVDENEAAVAVQTGLMTPDEALYLDDDKRRTITNSIGAGHGRVTQRPRIPLKRGYRFVLYTDGQGDNLTGEETRDLMRGQDTIIAIARIGSVVEKRMRDLFVILGNTPDRKTSGRYSDGYLCKPKWDNHGLIVGEIT